MTAAVVSLATTPGLTTGACAALNVSRASVYRRRAGLARPLAALRPRPSPRRALAVVERQPYSTFCARRVFRRPGTRRGLRHPARRGCGFRRMRTVIPIDCGQRFRSIADSVPVIADSGSRRRLQGLTRRCRCQAFHANPPVDTSSRPILWFDRHHPSAPTRTRLVPARTVAVKDGPPSGHRVSGAQRP